MSVISNLSATIPATTSVDLDLENGQRVGEYEVDGKLGLGAFGSVFRAVHPLIGKVVAIKVLARKFSVDPEMVSRFIAEARAVNQIRHRHIIDIFSFGQLADGRHYYVMEYLDGEPLDAVIDRRGRLELADALPILRGIGRALDAAHAKGIAHRDLKAENVFLGKNPDGGVFPKLLDFGIAKLLGREEDTGHKHRTRTGIPVGTPYYMSPEQCRGRGVDHRTDLYAFGVLAFLLLTGRYPLDADDHMTVLIRQMSDLPAPPSSLAPLPPGIDETVLWLMAKDPANRPPNLRAAVLALEAAAERAGILVHRSGSWDLPSGPHGQAGTQPHHTGTARSSHQPRLAASRSWVRIAAVAALAVAAGVGAMAITVSFRGDGELEPTPEPLRVATPEPPRPLPVVPAVVEPAALDTVTITVAGVPPNTEVIVAGSTVGVAPGPVQLPRGERPVVLTFKLDGYHPASRALTPGRDQALALQLARKAATRPRSSRDDLDDPFDPRRKP
jgi:eukaryotic-like serine/threonine-protein kinase